MRELLFRGQTRRYGEKVRVGDGAKLPARWVYGGVFHGEGPFSIIYGESDADNLLGKWIAYADTVGQYTGLEDKNGKRIFEGDVVIIGEHNQAVNGRYLVVWDAENHCWGLERSAEYHHHYFTFSALNGFSESAEVIGNIHDNPELLDGGESNA